MEPMGIERHRWASQEAKVSGTERVSTALSGSGRVDDIKGHPQGRGSRADELRQKIRKVGELIRLRQKIKTDVSDEAALLASLDKAATELDAGKGVPIERLREDVQA